MNGELIGVRLRQYLTEHFPSARRQSIGEEDSLLGNGILDSLGVLDLVGFLEQEFGISVADEDLVPEHFETIRHITAFVEGKRSVSSR